MGKGVDYQIAIRPQHHRFAKGHRVKLRISGGPSESLVAAAAVDVTVETGSASTLRLPGFTAAQ